MWSAATVLVCTLELLGRGAPSLPPIVLLDVRPPDVSLSAAAFVRQGEDAIYLITSSPTFAKAQAARDRCGEREALLKLASIVVHEETHLRDGASEEEAYARQVLTLIQLGAGPGSAAYRHVARSMRTALADGKRVRTAAEGARASLR